MKRLLLPCLALFAVFFAGCDSNPTNEPSKDAIEKANADRAAAIDNDPKLNQEQKDKMKQMMGLTPGGRPAGGPR